MNISHSKHYQKDDYADALMFAVLACKDAIDGTRKNDITRLKTQMQNNINWRKSAGYSTILVIPSIRDFKFREFRKF